MKKLMHVKKAGKRSNYSIQDVVQIGNESEDFVHCPVSTPHQQLWISFYKTLVDIKILHELLLKELHTKPFQSLEEIKTCLTFESAEITSKGDEALNMLLEGSVMVQLHREDNEAILVPLLGEVKRDMTIPEIEFTVVGPKEAFIESLDANIHLIRKRLFLPDLVVKELKVGKLTETKVAILYIKSIANQDNVETMEQRIKDIDVDQLVDSSTLGLMITGHTGSPFPEFLETERPDRAVTALAEGKVIALVNGSPQALIGPTTLVEFFSAFEDYFINWQLATSLRLLRLFAVWFSIFSTPLYVAFLTYHVELIPQDLLATLILSRVIIPFPPILEVLLLELTIELLREAGARLPIKVGQTIGIVGGIVIGTAAVEAGLTSNVLLIIVALAALASFTTPVYQMGNTIRYLRFPFILAAELWGVISISLLFCVLLIHVLNLKSLGRPYLEPIYPPRLTDFKDSLLRLPLFFQTKRPKYLQVKDRQRYQMGKFKEINNDIDE